MIKTPFLAVDGIIKLYDENENFKGIVLIERLNKPFGLAIPGGFVDIGETVEDAVVREMKEETSLEISIESLLGVYSDPKRDDRFHTVSVVYICKAYGVFHTVHQQIRRSDYDKRRYYQTRKSGCQETDSDER